MKHFFFFCLFSYFLHHLQSQNPYLAYKWAIRLDNTTEYRSSYTYNNHNVAYPITTWAYINPVISLSYSTKYHNQHRISLGGRRNFMPPRNYVYYTGAKLQYEYVYVFGKNTQSRWLPSMGAFVTLYAKSLTGSISSFNYNKESSVGAILGLTPRLTYYTHKQVFFEVGFPVSMFMFGQNTETKIDPASLDLEEFYENVSKFFPDRKGFNLLFSIGLTLYNPNKH